MKMENLNLYSHVQQLLSLLHFLFYLCLYLELEPIVNNLFMDLDYSESFFTHIKPHLSCVKTYTEKPHQSFGGASLISNTSQKCDAQIVVFL